MSPSNHRHAPRNLRPSGDDAEKALRRSQAALEAGAPEQQARSADRHPRGGARTRSARQPASTGATSAGVCPGAPSDSRDATADPSMPQGMIRSNQPRSVATFSATPWLVTPPASLTPIAPSFSIARPDAGVRRPAGDLDAVGGCGGDQRRLERPKVVIDVAVSRMARDREDTGEPDDRIGDELPGAMEGHRAAPIDLQELGAGGDERFPTLAEVPGLTLAAHRVDGRVLEEQHARRRSAPRLRRASATARWSSHASW